MLRSQFLSIISGLFASLASILGKLSLNAEEFQSRVCGGTDSDDVSISYYQELCLMVGPVAQLGCFALIFACNALMWTFLSKAMDGSDTTAEVLAVNSATNFLFASLVGLSVFQEKPTPYWLIGLIVTLIGLSFIHLSNRSSEPNNQKEE